MMKVYKLKYLLIIGGIIFSINLRAQENQTHIRVLSRAYPDSIVLRWAPDNYEGWIAGNKFGYKIVRYTIINENNFIQEPKPVTLTPLALKPWPLKQWEPYSDTDVYIGVGAQAIYGETFEFTNVKSTSVIDIVNKVKEQESRYSFALFAADMSPIAARASALWFTDKQVKKGEKYLYRVFLSSPDTFIKIDTGYTYTSIDEYRPLPKPLQFKAEFGDKGVILYWNRSILNSFYNSYVLERSVDSIHFERVRKEPLIYANSGDFEESDEMLYIDSLAENGKTYYYRLRGHNAFGELGPPAALVKGAGIEEIKVIPDIKDFEEINSHLLLKWNYPKEQENSISGFFVVRSAEPKTKPDTISNLVTPDSREFLDTLPQATNYYRIIVKGKNGTSKSSLPSLIQLIDTIPPAAPIGLKAVVDTTGKLTLSWKANQENDLYGYRIYRANALFEEYAQITVSPIKDTIYIDTINLKTLTSKIYYQIMAIDKRQNNSVFSKPLEVERPDIVPPAPPAIESIESMPEAVKISWIRSTSSDVSSHFFYRKMKNSDSLEFIKQIPISDTTYVFSDSTGKANEVYYYFLIACDIHGLKSIAAGPLAGEKLMDPSDQKISNLKYKINREKSTITLSWQPPKENIKRYIIYRKAGEISKLMVYSSIPGENNEFTDSKLVIDTKYTYGIKYVGNLTTSKLTTIDITY